MSVLGKDLMRKHAHLCNMYVIKGMSNIHREMTVTE